ncbi:hypothetical protein HZB01_01270 [Candidatus Woesearchaeota archaeon]|nr:hypothetical protein [Candidatus Woesearchaeota archaeon]
MEEEEHVEGESEENIYGKEARKEMVENDEVSPEEEAFMEGYEEAEEEPESKAEEEE